MASQDRWQSEQIVQDVIASARTIAVVGLSPRPERTSHRISKYMQEHGYRIIPVNPNATEVLGEWSYASLRDVAEPVDVVNVFRRPEYTPDIARDTVAIGAKTLWMQVGVVNEEAARIAEQGGVQVIMDL